MSELRWYCTVWRKLKIKVNKKNIWVVHSIELDWLYINQVFSQLSVFSFRKKIELQCHRDLMFFLLERAKCPVQKLEMFFKGHKNLKQTALENSSATLVTFFYPKIFIWALPLPTFDAFEYHIYTVVHYNESFRLVLK
jgi:hypothetical protein